MSKTLTKTDQTVKRIFEIMKESPGSVYSVGMFQNRLTKDGFHVSDDTIRKALSNLTDSHLIRAEKEKRLTTYHFVGFTQVEHTPAEPDDEPKVDTPPHIITKESSNKPKKRGWKMKAIRAQLGLLAQGQGIKRAFLAQLVHSDERNTHIMVSKIQQAGQFTEVVWDPNTKAFVNP